MNIIKDLFKTFDEDITNLYTYKVSCLCGSKKIVVTNTGYTETTCDECGRVLIPTDLVKIIPMEEL